MLTKYYAAILVLLLVVIPSASAFDIIVRDANTNASLNASINVTYNPYTQYQEFANSNSSPTQNSSGSYYQPSWSSTNKVFSANYTKTSLAINWTWQVKTGNGTIQNLTDSNCFGTTIQVQMYSLDDLPVTATSANNTLYCYNGTAFKTLYSLAGPNGSLGGSGADLNYTYDGDYETRYKYGSAARWTTNLTGENSSAAWLWEEGVWWGINSSSEIVLAPTGTATPPGQENYTSGTSGSISWSASTANITVTVPGYTSATASLASLASSNYTFNLTPSSTTTFYVYNEENGTLMSGVNVSIALSSTSNGTSSTTTNGTLTFNNLTYGEYTITYSATGYNQRTYTTFLPVSSAGTVILFLRSTATSTPVILQVRDESQQKVVGATVYMNKLNITGTNDYLVEMCITDVNGQCVVSADVTTTTVLSNTTYRFTVIYNSVTVGDSGYLTISTTANAACNSALPCVQLLVTLGSNPLETFFQIPNVQYTPITYTSSSGNFTFSVVDTTGIVQSFCIYTTVRAGATYAITNTSCVTSASGSVYVYSNTSLGEETIARGVIYVDGQEIVIDTLSIPNNSSGGVTNVIFFLFMGLLVLGTVFLSYKANASMAMLLTAGVAVILFYVSAFPLITNIFIVSVVLIILIVVARSHE